MALEALAAMRSANDAAGQHEKHNNFLDTSSNAALTVWNDLLRLQVEYFAPAEMAFLAGFAPWTRARSVLDVGCGNGLYASALRQRFPDKAFAGIDISPGLIAEARAADPAIRFEEADLFAYAPERPCDLVVMRFLVQHLTDFEGVLASVDRLLAPGGSLVVIEPDVAGSRNEPPTPFFEMLVKAFEEHRALDGRMRTRLAEPERLLDGVAGWAIAANRPIAVRQSGPRASSMAHGLFMKWVEALERSGVLTYPFDATREELMGWANLPDIESEIMLRALVFRRRRGG
jgi:SAM-dependent methyltransferase